MDAPSPYCRTLWNALAYASAPAASMYLASSPRPRSGPLRTPSTRVAASSESSPALTWRSRVRRAPSRDCIADRCAGSVSTRVSCGWRSRSVTSSPERTPSLIAWPYSPSNSATSTSRRSIPRSRFCSFSRVPSVSSPAWMRARRPSACSSRRAFSLRAVSSSSRTAYSLRGISSSSGVRFTVNSEGASVVPVPLLRQREGRSP
jgi:hypothetical protein